MITAAYGYRCVNVTSPDLSGYITGDIFPARDKRGDGTARVMRYEDLLFLQEAYAERRYWRAIPATKEDAAGRFIDGTVVDGAIYTVASGSAHKINSAYFGEYYDRDVQIGTPVSVSSTSGKWWEGLMGSPVADSLAAPQFGRRSVLAADKVRRAYYNTTRLTRTVAGVSSGDVMSSYTLSNAQVSSSSSTQQTSTSTSFGNLYSYSSGGRYTSWSLVSSAAYVNWRQIATYPFATSATLLVLVEWRNTSSALNHEIVPEACSVSRGVITIPDVLSRGFVQGVCARHGIAYISQPAYSSSRASYGVAIYDMALLVDHTFPAEIETLDWAWQPS